MMQGQTPEVIASEMSKEGYFGFTGNRIGVQDIKRLWELSVQSGDEFANEMENSVTPSVDDMSDEFLNTLLAQISNRFLIPQWYSKNAFEEFCGRSLTEEEWQDLLSDSEMTDAVDSAVLDTLSNPAE
ncbi:MAG TPA: hypothetical protein PLY87_01890 [Planctomycetaceae bacterium]|nr:hypothetical protein [Planctomycetaceae bacterium]